MTITEPTKAAAPARPTASPGDRTPPPRWRPYVVPTAVLLVLALLPYSALNIPILFDGPLNSPGSLQLLALCLVFAGFALGYDLMFGRTGLLSFGHGLYIAGGAYGTQLAMTELQLPLLPAAALTVVLGTVAAVVLGAISLRTLALGGIGFAMVTLAFAQAGAIWVERNPGGLTGGEEGLPLHTESVPDVFVGVSNTVNVYWLALAYLVVVAAVCWIATDRPVGRVWQAVRDNEERVGVLGKNPFRYKLGAFVLASALALLGGVVHLLVTAGATPHSSTPEFTLTLLVMVVLGGAGTRWGPIVGGLLFTFLDQRLPSWGIGGEPMLVLGTLFVLAVYVAPGGLTSLRERFGGRTQDRKAPAEAVPAGESSEGGTTRKGTE